MDADSRPAILSSAGTIVPGERLPTGRDIYSTDIRLVCSAGDLDFDCDVDFVDYAQLAREWCDVRLETNGGV